MKKSKFIYIIPIIIILIVGLVCLVIYFNDSNLDNDNKGNSGEVSNKNTMTGKERVNGQSEVIDILNNYVKSIPNLYEYAQENNLTSISVNELNKLFKVNISAFKQLPYNCSLDKTTINFKTNYEEYYISLDCEAFYLE